MATPLARTSTDSRPQRDEWTFLRRCQIVRKKNAPDEGEGGGGRRPRRRGSGGTLVDSPPHTYTDQGNYLLRQQGVKQQGG
eukprot:gene20036-biopygen20570